MWIVQLILSQWTLLKDEHLTKTHTLSWSLPFFTPIVLLSIRQKSLFDGHLVPVPNVCVWEWVELCNLVSHGVKEFSITCMPFDRLMYLLSAKLWAHRWLIVKSCCMQRNKMVHWKHSSFYALLICICSIVLASGLNCPTLIISGQQSPIFLCLILLHVKACSLLVQFTIFIYVLCKRSSNIHQECLRFKWRKRASHARLDRWVTNQTQGSRQEKISIKKFIFIGTASLVAD